MRLNPRCAAQYAHNLGVIMPFYIYINLQCPHSFGGPWYISIRCTHPRHYVLNQLFLVQYAHNLPRSTSAIAWLICNAHIHSMGHATSRLVYTCTQKLCVESIFQYKIKEFYQRLTGLCCGLHGSSEWPLQILWFCFEENIIIMC